MLRQITARGAIVLAFVAALEIVIMISPFAAFFYSVFNPVLLSLNQSPATRWLTAFFLPHMIVPPNDVLTAIRVAGSVFFLAGIAIFLLCALQVYYGKLRKWGAAEKGLYRIIRHPQYTALAIAGLGLAIMWPRMLTLVLLAVMFLLYYVLARDEERRMVNRYGESYGKYLERVGMFFPRLSHRNRIGAAPTSGDERAARVAGIAVVLLLLLVGCGFGLRAYTVSSLPIEEISGVDVLPISSDDSEQVSDLMPGVLADSSVSARVRAIKSASSGRLLAYFMPVDYVMQGMIANTGEEWKLFEQHKTIGMITEYILHPFAHLTGGHSHHAVAGMKHGPEMYALPMMQRRVIIVEVGEERGTMNSPQDDFGMNVRRIPRFFVDVHLHTGEIVQVKDTPAGSGWGSVPTPVF